MTLSVHASSLSVSLLRGHLIFNGDLVCSPQVGSCRCAAYAEIKCAVDFTFTFLHFGSETMLCGTSQANRNEYGNTPAMTATQADCKEALSAVILGGESARLKLAEEIEAAAAEAEAARLDEYMQREER